MNGDLIAGGVVFFVIFLEVMYCIHDLKKIDKKKKEQAAADGKET